MKVKMVFTALVMLLSLVVMSQQNGLPMTAFEKATEYGAKVRIVYVVEDDLGQPVPGARVHIWLGLESNKDGGMVYYDYTDNNGRYVLDGKTTGLVRYWFVKDGYYESEGELRLEGIEDEQNAVRDGKWQPYGRCKRIVLKRVRNPTARPFHYGDFPVPVFGKWMGFDLERFDLCPPYGKGVHKDVLLRYIFDRDPVMRGKVYASMEMSFANNPYAGAYILKKDKWSDFQSCYAADTNNAFSIKMFKYEISRTREEIFKKERFPEDSYIVFKTRTTVDRDGNLVSAHYGKIYGDWSYPRWIKFGGTLFNSNPNDPNLEDEESGNRARMYINGMRERGELR